MKSIIVNCLLMFVLLLSCKQNSEDAAPRCDTANVTYSTTITGIITTYKCRNCHNNTFMPAGINAESYASLRAPALNGRLYGALSHTSPYIAMPLGAPKMSDCDLAKVKAWIDAGAPNN